MEFYLFSTDRRNINQNQVTWGSGLNGTKLSGISDVEAASRRLASPPESGGTPLRLSLNLAPFGSGFNILSRRILAICVGCLGSVFWLPTSAAATEPHAVPAYEWNLNDLAKNEGRVVPNTGSRGAKVAPVGQALAASGVVLDEDGNYSHQRVVWDPEVADPLNHHEAITLKFTEESQKQSFLVRRDHPELQKFDLVFSVWVKRKGEASGKFTLGSASKASGATTVFEAPAEWTQLTIPFKSDDAPGDITLAPAKGGTLPCDLAIYAPMIRKAGTPEIPLAEFRAARQAGHAYAPLALPGAAKMGSEGGLSAEGSAQNLQAELAPEPVKSFALSGWIKVEKLPMARGFFAGFSRTENPSENPEKSGSLGIYGEGGMEDFHGRLQYSPGKNLDKQLYSPHFDGSGWLHVHINYGHAGSDLVMPSGKVAHELLINGIPFHERATDPMSEIVPRLLSLGGLDGSAKSIQNAEGVWGNPFALVRYEPNTRVSRDEVLARVKQDRANFSELREPLDALIVVEGDSTSAFRGSPINMYSRMLRQPGRLFVNHSRGGAWYQGGKESNSDYIGTGQRRAMRRDAMTKGLDLGYRKVFTLWTPGENDGCGRGVLRVGGDANEAVQTFTDFILDDREAVDPERKRVRSIFVSMKMSDFSDGVKESVRHYWKALEAIYSEPVDAVNAPYLYRAPAGTPGRTHDYFIAMHKWVPTNGKHTWKNWEELARDAKADQNGAKDIISGDGQHWTQGWNPYVSEAVFVPSLKKIFELEGVVESKPDPAASK